MKKILLFIVFIVSMTLVFSCSKNAPVEPESGLTPVSSASPTVTRTITLTGTCTPTFTATLTSTITPVYEISANIVYDETDGFVNSYITVKADSTPYSFAAVSIDNISDMDAAETIPWNASENSYTKQLSMPIIPGNDYRLAVEIGETVLSETLTAPGNITISSTGLTFSWANDGTRNTVIIYRNDPYANILNEMNVTNPYTVSPDPRVAGYSYTSYFWVESLMDSVYLPLPFGGASNNNRYSIYVYKNQSFSIDTP